MTDICWNPLDAGAILCACWMTELRSLASLPPTCSTCCFEGRDSLLFLGSLPLLKRDMSFLLILFPPLLRIGLDGILGEGIMSLGKG